MNALSGEVATLTNTDQLARLPRLSQAARILRSLFIQLGPGAPIGVDPSRPYLIRRLTPRKRFLFSWQPTGSAHPLARVSMALLRFQNLGGTLSTADTQFIAWCDTIRDLRRDIDAYRRNSFPASF